MKKLLHIPTAKYWCKDFIEEWCQRNNISIDNHDDVINIALQMFGFRLRPFDTTFMLTSSENDDCIKVCQHEFELVDV